MVLLKNEEETLPLLYDQNVALLGNAVINLVDGASGSANVNNAETVNLLEGEYSASPSSCHAFSI